MIDCVATIARAQACGKLVYRAEFSFVPLK
jgi:hypothetical protein